MRVLAYNILNGCHDRHRRELFYDFITDAKADIVGIVEADGWQGREPGIAKHLGYPYTTVPSRDQPGFWKHMAVFSKLPFTGACQVPLAYGPDGPHHGGLVTSFDVQGKPLRVTLAHLKYNSEPTRIAEIQKLLPCADHWNAVLMGDLNTFAPDSGYDDPAYARSLEDYVRQYGGQRDLAYMLPRLHATRDVHDYETIRRILASYQDAHPGPVQQWYTLPTGIDPIEARRPPEKLDYIFASKHLALSNPQVHRTLGTALISDHYPVSVDIAEESLK